jgi:hypothetical protein
MNPNISRRVLIASMACGMAFMLAACNNEEPVAAAPPLPALPASAHQSDLVQVWSLKASETYNASSQFPADPADATKTDVERRPAWNVEIATVHLAMYDAIMAVVGTHKPFLVTPTATAPNSARAQDAAVMAAAYGVIKGFWPDRGPVYQPTYDEKLLALNSGAVGDEPWHRPGRGSSCKGARSTGKGWTHESIRTLSHRHPARPIPLAPGAIGFPIHRQYQALRIGQRCTIPRFIARTSDTRQRCIRGRLCRNAGLG